MQLSHQKIYKEFESKSINTSLSELQTEIDTYLIIRDSIDNNATLSQLENIYDSSTINNYLNIQETNKKSYLQNTKNVIRQLMMKERLGQYADYNLQVLEETQKLLERHENNKKSFDYKSLRNMERVYSNLKDVKIEEVSNLSVDAYVSSNYRELVILVFILFLVNTILGVDTESEMTDVLTLTELGKRRLSLNKLVTISILVFVFALLNEVQIIFYTVLKFGSFDWFFSIQSFNSLILSPYNISVIQLVIMSFIIKMLYSVAISFVFYGIVTVFKNKSIGIVFSVLTTGVSIFLFFSIQDSSVYRNLKYVNLYGVTKIFQMFKGQVYLNLNMFSSSWLRVSFIFIITLLAGSLILSHYLYVNYEDVFSMTREKVSKVKHRYESISLIKHEAIKSVMMEGNGLILLTAFFMIVLMNVNILNTPISNYELSIESYINEYGGKIDEHMINHFESKKMKYAKIESDKNRIVEQYNLEQITDQQYQDFLNDYFSIKDEMNVFSVVIKQFERAGMYLINTKGYDFLTAQYDYKNDHTIAFILMTTVVLLISNFYSIDQRNSEDIIYDVSHKGHKIRNFTKLFLTVFLTVTLVVIVYVLYYLVVLNKYGLYYNNIELSNIVNLEINSIGFQNNSELLSYSITKYFVLVLFTRLCGYLFIAIASLIISKLVKKRSMVLILLSFVFIIPSILYILGYNYFYFVTVFDMISGNVYFRMNGSFNKIIFISIANVTLITYLVYKCIRNKAVVLKK